MLRFSRLSLRQQRGPVLLLQPSPEKVGILQSVNPIKAGGELRVRIKDWEVREVDMKGRLAVLDDAPVWGGLEKAEKVGGKEAPLPIIKKMEEEREEDLPRKREVEEGAAENPKIDFVSNTENLVSAFWRGFESQPWSFLEEKGGEEAVEKVKMWISKVEEMDREMEEARENGEDFKKSKTSKNYFSVCILEADDIDQEKLMELRGALSKIVGPWQGVAPLKIFSDNRAKLYAGRDLILARDLKKLFLEAEIPYFLAFSTAGFCDSSRLVKLSPSSARIFSSGEEEEKDDLRRRLRGLNRCFPELNISVKRGGGGVVDLSWSTTFSAAGLHGGGRRRFVLKKANIDLPKLQRALEKELKLPSGQLHFAGLKDKRGITFQHASLPMTHSEEEIEKAVQRTREKLSKGWLEVGNFEEDSTGHKIKWGELSGNYFKVCVRGVDASKIPLQEQGVRMVAPQMKGKGGGRTEHLVKEKKPVDLSCLERGGFVNYYGIQRFGFGEEPQAGGDGGRSSRHVKMGGAILTKDYQKAVELWLEPAPSDSSEGADIRREFLASGDAYSALRRMESLGKGGDNRDLESFKEVIEELHRVHSIDRFRRAIRRIPRSLLHLYPAAFYACLWNRQASKRLEEGGRLLREGDLVEVEGRVGTRMGSMKRLEKVPEGGREGSSIFDVKIPMLGLQREGCCPVLHAGVNVLEYYSELLEDAERRGEIEDHRKLELDLSYSLGLSLAMPCIPRRMLVRPRFLEGTMETGGGGRGGEEEEEKGDLTLQFWLPRGSFATMMLREVM